MVSDRTRPEMRCLKHASAMSMFSLSYPWDSDGNCRPWGDATGTDVDTLIEAVSSDLNEYTSSGCDTQPHETRKFRTQGGNARMHLLTTHTTS